MVGGQRQHDRRLAPPQRMHGARDDRRRGIAAMRLEQDIGLDADLAELLGDQKPVLVVGDDHRPCENLSVADASDRLLKRRARTEQAQELLGPPLARGGPQARPRPSAHDEGNDRFGHRRSVARSVNGDGVAAKSTVMNCPGQAADHRAQRSRGRCAGWRIRPRRGAGRRRRSARAAPRPAPAARSQRPGRRRHPGGRARH